jgi:hypothetical protein
MSTPAQAAGAVAFALGLAAAPQAMAQNRDSPLVRGLLDMPADDQSRAERYQTPDGRVKFVLDRTGERVALVRFEGVEEVHVLHLVPGPRGDDIYKTDTGDVLLRVTALGSVIVYVDSARMGAPAQAAGRSAPVAPPVAPVNLRARMELLARDAARRLGRPVAFEAPEVQGPASGVVADAAARAAEGLSDAPHTVTVRRVIIRTGDAPGAVMVNESLTVTVTPQMGYAGRPSAAAIRRAVEGEKR